MSDAQHTQAGEVPSLPFEAGRYFFNLAYGDYFQRDPTGVQCADLAEIQEVAIGCLLDVHTGFPVDAQTHHAGVMIFDESGELRLTAAFSCFFEVPYHLRCNPSDPGPAEA